MKFAFTLIICFFITVIAFAQVRKHVPVKPRGIVAHVLLKTQNDSISYAAGVNQVRQLKSMRAVFNLNALNKAIEDSLGKKKTLINLKQAEGLLENFSKRKKDSTKVIFDAANVGTAFKFRSAADSVSYAYGIYVAGTFAGDYGIRTLSYKLFNTAISAGIANKPLLLNALQSRKVLANIYRPEFTGNIAASKKFLAENKGKPGVVTLPDGLQYMVLKPGTGANVMMGDSVIAHYKGTLADGIPFDSSYDRGEPLKLDDITKVIAGWTEGLQLMNLGAKYRFFIPPNLAYGSRKRSDVIVPYSALIFDVEVLKIGTRSL